MKLYLENGFLSCELLSAVLFGEGNVNVKLIADIFADYLILRAENQRVTLCLAAFKRLTVCKAFKIDNNGIALFSRAILYRYHTGIALRHGVNLCVNLCRVNLNGGLFSL